MIRSTIRYTLFATNNAVEQSWAVASYCSELIFPCSFKRVATGAELTFHHSIIGNFMVNKI